MRSTCTMGGAASMAVAIGAISTVGGSTGGSTDSSTGIATGGSTGIATGSSTGIATGGRSRIIGASVVLVVSRLVVGLRFLAMRAWLARVGTRRQFSARATYLTITVATGAL